MENKWFVVFKTADRPRWWHRPFAREGFGHTFCFAQTGHFITMVDPANHGVVVQTLYNLEDSNITINADALALAYVQQGYTVVYYENKVDVSKYLLHFVPSCVTVVKYILGITSRALTPHGLYQWLLSNGGVKLTEENIMGSMFKQKALDTSKQQAQLEAERKQAKAEAERVRKENVNQIRSRRRMALGQSSLIRTSELGAKETLG